MTTSPPPEIIAREQAYWHGFGKSITQEERALSGVDKLLMSDESISYGCQTCDYTNPNMKSVQTHLTKHSTKGYGVNKYEPELVEKILKWEQIERTAGIRGWAERVAKRLNKAKYTTLQGNQWLAADVHSLARRGRDNAESEHDPMAALLNSATTVATVTALVTNPDTPKLIDAVANVARSRIFGLDTDLVTRMAETTDPAMTAKIITDLVGLLAIQAKPCQHSDYEELKAKAAMLDQMRSFMGEGK